MDTACLAARAELGLKQTRCVPWQAICWCMQAIGLHFAIRNFAARRRPNCGRNAIEEQTMAEYAAKRDPNRLPPRFLVLLQSDNYMP